MRKRGFSLHRTGTLTYWYHPGEVGGTNAEDSEADAATAAAAAAANAASTTVEAPAVASIDADGRPPPTELFEQGSGEQGRGNQAGAKDPTPIVFVHGVGLGPLPYKGLIDNMLTNARGAPMLVLELPFVSQRLSGLHKAPQEARTSQEIADAMATHGSTPHPPSRRQSDLA